MAAWDRWGMRYGHCPPIFTALCETRGCGSLRLGLAPVRGWNGDSLGWRSVLQALDEDFLVCLP